MHRKTDILQNAWIIICKKRELSSVHNITARVSPVHIFLLKRHIPGMLALYHAPGLHLIYREKAFSTFSIVILLFYV